jgi:hypothetical protein
MFPFPSILQHYVEIDIHTIARLEKLFGVGSFGGSSSQPACHQAIFPAFSSGLGFPSIVWIVAFKILGCWALIVLALISRF